MFCMHKNMNLRRGGKKNRKREGEQRRLQLELWNRWALVEIRELTFNF